LGRFDPPPRVHRRPGLESGGMTLIVTLEDGRSEAIFVPEGMDENQYLDAFVSGRHPFENKPWVKLATGEYVRHGFIVAIRRGRE